MAHCSRLLLALGLTLLLSTAAPAQDRRVRTGELTCSGGRSVGFIVGSHQDLRCTFRSFRTGRRYAYSGTVRRIGLDIGVTSASRSVWLVFSAPTTRVGRSTLVGTYVGASGDASFGLGAGASVLVGGFNRSISLQPLSVQGQVGVNLAVGVSSLSLR